jgi:hypothetical protein
MITRTRVGVALEERTLQSLVQGPVANLRTIFSSIRYSVRWYSNYPYQQDRTVGYTTFSPSTLLNCHAVCSRATVPTTIKEVGTTVQVSPDRAGTLPHGGARTRANREARYETFPPSRGGFRQIDDARWAVCAGTRKRVIVCSQLLGSSPQGIPFEH